MRFTRYVGWVNLALGCWEAIPHPRCHHVAMAANMQHLPWVEGLERLRGGGVVVGGG